MFSPDCGRDARSVYDWELGNLLQRPCGSALRMRMEAQR